MSDRFDSREFYELMYAYRTAPGAMPDCVVEAFDAVRDYLRSTPKQGEAERTVSITEKQLAAEIEKGFMAGAKHAMETIAPQALLALEAELASTSVEPPPQVEEPKP